MLQLPYTPIPVQGESFASIALRFAYKNGYENIEQLFRAFRLGDAGIIRNQWRESPIYKLLMKQEHLSKKNRELIKSAFHKRLMHHRTDYFELNNIRIPSIFFRQSLALCPSCVRDGHLDHMHSYIFCNFCPKHNEYYFESCPNCELNFDWRSIKNYRCQCGMDLKNLESAPANRTALNLLIDAVYNHDSDYVDQLVAALRCTKFLEFRSNTDLLDSCLRIATGDKHYFFSHIRTLQESMPSLHRRAILAPWLLCENLVLRGHAIEYYFNASQTKPREHSQGCTCGEMLFSPKELRYILNNHTPRKPPYRNKKGVNALLKVNNLCLEINNNKSIHWEVENSQPYPSEATQLLNATEAANALQTSKQTIQRLHNAGLISGERFSQKIGILITLKEVERFRREYILNREIARNLGIRPRTVHTMLKSAKIEEVRPDIFNSSLIVYKTGSIPFDLLNFLRTPRLQVDTPKDRKPLNGVLYSEAASKLRLDPKNIPKLIQLGILEQRSFIRESGDPGRELCTKESLRRALRWRSKLLTFSEAAEYVGCSVKILHMRFVSSEYIREIRLTSTSLMTQIDADRVRTHFKLYTTTSSARSEYCLGPRTLNKLIQRKKITPLPRSDKNYLNGQVTILRSELFRHIHHWGNK
ncbi:TniQ family protein [Pseudomonas sp. MOB-449]|nr:TniQ family protein [Pseudomonas sp. MOB-449]